MIKKIILVRHGDYGEDGDLTDLGRKQIASIARKLMPFVDGQMVAIFHSPVGRTYVSAALIGFTLSPIIAVKGHKSLRSSDDKPDLPATANLVRCCEDDIEVLILVTHAAHVLLFPPYFMGEQFAEDVVIQVATKVVQGEARVIDCEQKTLTRVLPDCPVFDY